MNFIAWTPFFVLFAGFSIWSLWHLTGHDSPFMPKWAWALLIVFAMPVGTLIYFLVAVLGAGVQRHDAEGRPDA
jgi:hypothetical protein